jgi:hypothetical protein
MKKRPNVHIGQMREYAVPTIMTLSPCYHHLIVTCTGYVLEFSITIGKAESWLDGNQESEILATKCHSKVHIWLSTLKRLVVDDPFPFLFDGREMEQGQKAVLENGAAIQQFFDNQDVGPRL